MNSFLYFSIYFGLPALYAATSAFCLALGLIVSGIVVGVEKLIDYCLSHKQQEYSFVSSLLSSPKLSPSFDDNTNTISSDDDYRPGGSSTHQVENQGFTTVYDILEQAFFPFLSSTFSQKDYEILKQGLTYQLKSYGDDAIPYYFILALDDAKYIMNKDDRFEELCRICGVAAARVEKAEWEEWKRRSQKDQQEENEDKDNAPPITPILGEAARFVILEGKDPYKILGISRYASYAEIKKAFYKMALRCHPDKVGETGVEAFKTVNTAYEFLSEPDSRQDVDDCLDQKGDEKVAASQCG